jgi:predicted  nucleic acid-binding Zn-ribbon protein
MKDILTEDERADLIPIAQEATNESGQEHPPVVARNQLLEQAMRYWEQSVHDLQKEVRELRDRIDQLERQHKNEKTRGIPVLAESVHEREPEQAPYEERLSRTDRMKSQRGRWF